MEPEPQPIRSAVEELLTLLPFARPRLRGYSHAVAAVLSIPVTIILVALAAPDHVKQLTLAIYGVTAVLLFGVSAAYHSFTWSPHTKSVLRRIDHANIFLLIAGTYTPVAVNLLSGGVRVFVLITVWAVALFGALVVAPAVRRIPDWLTAIIYLGMGWMAVVAMPQLITAAGLTGLALLGGGGVLYSLGALSYATKRPRLWENTFGYHEVFHVLVIGANTLFVVFMFVEVLGARRA